MDVRQLCAWCFTNTWVLYGDFSRINQLRSFECNQSVSQVTLGHSQGISVYPRGMT